MHEDTSVQVLWLQQYKNGGVKTSETSNTRPALHAFLLSKTPDYQ